MKKNNKLAAAAVSAAIATLCSSGVFAGPANPSANTANLEYGEVLRIRLPYGLCEFERTVPAYVVDKLSTRRDWNKLVTYMLTNCPELGLSIADTATASISQSGADGSGDGTGSGTGSGAEPGGGSDGTPDTGTGGTGGSDDDDDGNNGHGNDSDRHDESNPGKKAD